MAQDYSTETIAQKLRDLHLPFADCFARALVALLSGKKISLHQLTHLMPGEQNPEANRQQMRRCLEHENLTPEAWTHALSALLPRTKWILALDRTEWKRGDTTVNLLVLAVVTDGCAVPLLWTVMPECGSSDTAERIALLSRFVGLFGRERLRFLTADREFIGWEWIGWLQTQQIPFRIRIKAGEYLSDHKGQERKAWQWFSRANRCRCQKMQLWGLGIYVGGRHLHGREYLIVISNEQDDLLADYRLRWKIETLFQAFKGRGFEMEACRLTDSVRWGAFLGFLSLSLVWCLRVGAFLEHLEPTRLKAHGRLAMSVFRRGLDHLQALLAPLSGRACEAAFILAVRQLRPAEIK
jgi:hypothetical protein